MSLYSPDLQHAVLAVEDRRFYHHPGLDPIGIGRAALRDVRRGGRVEGASTVTQQLARTLFLSNVRTYGRKVKEAGIEAFTEQRAMLFQLVDALPPDQRQVIIRRFVDQRSVRDIAQEFGRSEGAVKQLQFRALQTLRSRMRSRYV